MRRRPLVRVARALGATALVALCSVFSAVPARAADGPVYSTQEEVFADTQTAPCDEADRLAAVRALFGRYGATDTDMSVFTSGKITNLVVTIKGSGPGYLVVGAHYDKVRLGCGAIDNWTGIVLLAHTYRTFRPLKPKRTMLFVAFGAEEEGLKGSKAMVDAIAKSDRASYCAMVNLDSFGLARPQVLLNTTSTKIVPFVRTVAEACKVPIATASLEGEADADSSSFKAAGIPAVTLHGMTSDWAKILHSPNDKASRIGAPAMYLAYILTLNLVGRLDGCDCGAFR